MERKIISAVCVTAGILEEILCEQPGSSQNTVLFSYL